MLKGKANAPLVAVIMGSKSDWDTLRHADEKTRARTSEDLSLRRDPSL